MNKLLLKIPTFTHILNTFLLLLKNKILPTRPDNGPLLHQDHCVRLLYKLQAVSAEDPGFALEELDNTLLHQVFGHISVNCCQRVVQQVDVFVLNGSQDTTRR